MLYGPFGVGHIACPRQRRFEQGIIQKAKELKNMSLELRKGIEKFKLKKESQTEVEEMLSVANHKLKITS